MDCWIALMFWIWGKKKKSINTLCLNCVRRPNNVSTNVQSAHSPCSHTSFRLLPHSPPPSLPSLIPSLSCPLLSVPPPPPLGSSPMPRSQACTHNCAPSVVDHSVRLQKYNIIELILVLLRIWKRGKCNSHWMQL